MLLSRAAPEGVAKVAALPLAGFQVGGVVQFLEHGVDQVAFEVENENIVVAALLQEVAEPRDDIFHEWCGNSRPAQAYPVSLFRQLDADCP